MRKWKNKSGYSLVELIVAFAIIMIVFAVIVPQFRAIRNSWAGTEAKGEIIQNGRILAEHIARSLAAAAQIIAVSPDSDPHGFIMFQDNDGNQIRYMLAGGYVVFGPVGSEQQLAGPVERFQISCYSLKDFDNPTTDANVIRLVQIETDFANDALGSDKTFSSEVFIQTNKQSASGQSVIDIMVKSGKPDTAFDYTAGDHGCNAVLDIDNWQNPSVIHGLLCFKNIVGDEADQVPQGAEVTVAKLRLWYVNHNGNANVYLYRMTVPWDETSTWNSIGGGLRPGVNCEDANIVKFGNSVPKEIEIDVTNIVRDWVSGGYPNYGFGIINSSNNNIQFAASENTADINHSPKLKISYLPPAVAMQTLVYCYSGDGIIDCYNSSDGPYDPNTALHNATVTVNTTGTNRIYLYNNSRLYGDAYIGPGGNVSKGIVTGGGAQITGDRSTLAEPVALPVPTPPTGVGPYLGNLTLTGSSLLINSDKYYNNVYLNNSYLEIDGNIRMRINGYLYVYNNSSIRIRPGSTLDLYVGGSYCYVYRGQLNAHYDKQPADLRIYMFGNRRWFYILYNPSEVYALLDNPRGYVYNYLGQFYGRMRGYYLYDYGGIHIDLDCNFPGYSPGGPQHWLFSVQNDGQILP